MAKQRICLSMIVKNEAPVIERCLASLLPLIDYWVICDTGSTDGTQETIRSFFARHELPGELHEREWRDFAHNRTEALELARSHGDYTLIIDADDVLELARNFRLPLLKADSYTIDILHQELRYPRAQLVRNTLPWRYEGVLHEFLTCGLDSNGNRIFSENRSQRPLTGACIRMSEQGARRRQSSAERYKRDAEVLSAALAREGDPYLIARYTFYLAQSHENSGDHEAALPLYLKRAELGFWDQEIYISLYRAARLKIQLQSRPDDVIATFERASAVDPRRAEALHGAARFCRVTERYEQGFALAQRAARLAPPPGALFIETWIYDYGALDELCVTAYWAGRYEISRKTARKLLLGGKLPKSETDRIAANAKLASDAMKTRPAALPTVDSLSTPEKNTVAAPEEYSASALEGDTALRTGEPADVVVSYTETLRADLSNSDTEETDNDNLQRSVSDTETQLPSSTPNPAATTHSSNTIHVIGVAHTVPHEDYVVCAFTAKVLLFPDVIQPFGWTVVEYSNEGSASNACEHLVILSKQRLNALSKRSSRNEPMDADVGNRELQQEFQRTLIEKLRIRVRPGDIICHVWGPNMEVCQTFPNCHHVEMCVGYTASPGLPFRIYETSAWMHWHYGKAGQEDGHNYKWVIPSPIDTEIWEYCEQPADYAVFLGRVSGRKGINILVEIARRMPDLPIHVYGPGDTSHWADAPPNIVFKGPVFGRERVEVVRRARCMLMPTIFIEPFGNSGVEAQLCGVPLIGSSYGAFCETIIDGVTGYRCNTLADWVEAIQQSAKLDRRTIAESARSRYTYEVIGRQYDQAFRQLADLSNRGWYSGSSHKFAKPAIGAPTSTRPRQPRIFLYMPYYGQLPTYFQLYLDSLARNTDYLYVFFLTDTDLANYSIPENLIHIKMSLDELRKRCGSLLATEFGYTVDPETLIKSPYKLCDFRVTFLKLFDDISVSHGVTSEDFVGWGDCDVIYGRFSDFLDFQDGYHIVGGYHGHLTACRNIEEFRGLFHSIDGLLELLLDDKSHIIDEVAFRKPLLELLDRNRYKMFYSNRYFCDVVPEQFYNLFRTDYAQRSTNFFDGYHPDKEIEQIICDRQGRLVVQYKESESRRALYCHLQKRSMSVLPGHYEEGYYIHEDGFVPVDSRSSLDPTLSAYLDHSGPHCMEIGAGWTARPGWLGTDLNPPADVGGMKLDATKAFPIPSETFDYVYSEHMIEHVPFDDGLNMLEECNRILKPGGTIRIVTPSLGFLSRVVSADRGMLEDRYRRWSVETFVPEAPAVTNAFFLNNFVRNWGHKFIYDRETLEMALRLSGFERIVACELNDSDHPSLRGLANVGKIPPGFLDLESMVFEGTKPLNAKQVSPKGRMISIGKPASQSSISQWSREATSEADAARVVSGHFSGSYNCHTDLDSRAWWRVDLERPHQINEVHIYNRVDANPMITGRLNRLEIQVSDDDRTWRTVFRKETGAALTRKRENTPFIWRPGASVPGRFLRIQLLDRQYLHLEQVEIFGEPPPRDAL
jgi:predicted SAM-dependent methyltransferase/glycosyltransferase involved in cell wall biosynthesis